MRRAIREPAPNLCRDSDAISPCARARRRGREGLDHPLKFKPDTDAYRSTVVGIIIELPADVAEGAPLFVEAPFRAGPDRFEDLVCFEAVTDRGEGVRRDGRVAQRQAEYPRPRRCRRTCRQSFPTA